MSASSEDTYALGYDPRVQRLLEMRTAERSAGFLLPHLSPGMSLLDSGCGPGTITVGLARAVAPGEVVAIDLEESQLEEARRHAVAAGVSNVSFQVASALELPFPDKSFDVVFFHAVLCHLPDPIPALAEARRVLKFGGLVAVRDVDMSGWYTAPTDPRRDRIYEIFAGIVEEGGGDAHIGRRLRPLLHEAGCARTVGSASFIHYGDADSVRHKSEARAEALSPGTPLAANASRLGLTPRQLEETAAAWRELAARDGAFIAEAWGEALGWKDGD